MSAHNEVEFAKWLAKPETTGGVVVVLQQPAEHQRYFSNPHQTVKDYDTLDAVDEVCKTVTGCGLEKISCFDVFPFHKIPVAKSLDEYEEELDEAYAIFLARILPSTKTSSASELDAPAIIKSPSKANATPV
ncbi:hypothetical protein BKA61DRAFT_681925 [Leptodontidium sp. MPI-SDFR-AT-0119]|nr:hypothetical protein BKA61DRAFT_681925 [Leptodontidium sp. MPI-SDFR-AT-0119]